MDTATVAYFGDEEQTFFLPMARVIATEREADASIFEIFHGLGQNLGALGEDMVLTGPSPSRLKQCHSLIRNALIGGGMDETTAREMISTYCYPVRPAVHDLALAWQILKAAVYGVDPGSKKKSDAASESPSDSARESSSSTATTSV